MVDHWPPPGAAVGRLGDLVQAATAQHAGGCSVADGGGPDLDLIEKVHEGVRGDRLERRKGLNYDTPKSQGALGSDDVAAPSMAALFGLSLPSPS